VNPDRPPAVPIDSLDPRRLEAVIGGARVEQLIRRAADLRERLGRRRIVNVNSTANGGGVAEMLRTLLGYAVGAGIDAQWLVIEGDPYFFAVTKRIHNGLYGGPGDGGELGPAERATYERSLARNAPGIQAVVRPDDIVIVHDPQPAGLIPGLLEHGAHVVWRCHVGLDDANEWESRAWAFVRPYVETAHAFVFSRASFAPPWIEERRLHVVPPSIDPFAPKNEDLDPEGVLGVLRAAGLVSGDATTARVKRQARVVRDGDPPGSRVPLVVQVSRWDRMKDMAGVLEGFVEHVDPATGAQLVLAGPAVEQVSDDPEDAEIWNETIALWQELRPVDRARVQLAAVPMDDPVENALVINALQRHAAIVVQKSLAEGFGLTVAEAMWKSRPVVASDVGGIADQVIDGETGLLLRDPRDLEGFGALLTRLLEAPSEAVRLGTNARQRIVDQFLPDRQLLQYVSLVAALLERATP
jgi:trehalose synthase